MCRLRKAHAARGWSHLALWSHFGDKYRRCLSQSRTGQAHRVLPASGGADSLRVPRAGPPSERPEQSASTVSDVDLGQVKEFGADAAALAYAAKNKDPLFFRKRSDWGYEAEYRLVLLNQSEVHQLHRNSHDDRPLPLAPHPLRSCSPSWRRPCAPIPDSRKRTPSGFVAISYPVPRFPRGPDARVRPATG